MTAIYQLSMLADEPAVIAGDVVDRIRYLLETYPDTRNSYQALMMRYWLKFDGLGDMLSAPEKAQVLVDWFANRATCPKTIQNRAMELQRRTPQLDAHPEIRERRRRQATQGPVR